MLPLPKNCKYPTILQSDEAILKEIFLSSKFYVCGGRALSYHLNKSPFDQDIDLFFTSESQYDNAIEELESYISKNFVPNTGNKKLDSQYALTYFLQAGTGTFVIQLIKKIYSSIESIFDSFDMNHCAIGRFFFTGFVAEFHGNGFYQAIRKKEIHINKMHPRILNRVWKAMCLGLILSENSVVKLLNYEEPHDFTQSLEGEYASI